MDDVESYNRWAWDCQVKKGNRWTKPVSSEVIGRAKSGDWKIVLTPVKPVPKDWLGEIQGKDVLCLAGGGGQQAPILAAAGANVTTVDNSPKQLDRDQEVARREGLKIETQLGDMADLNGLEDESFDLIVHPCSNGFVPDVRPVWREANRVLRSGGNLISGFTNPLHFLFDYEAMESGELRVVHSIPYSDTESLTSAELQKLKDDEEPLLFGHTLEDQLGGQIDAGFSITGFYEDRTSDETDAVLARRISIYIATRATKTSP